MPIHDAFPSLFPSPVSPAKADKKTKFPLFSAIWDAIKPDPQAEAKFLKYEDIGVDQVLCYVNWGYLPQEAMLECITLLGDYVIPELKRMGAKRTAGGLEKSIAMQVAAE